MNKYIGLFICVFLMALAGRISFEIPFGSGIPITGQSLAVLLIGYFMPWQFSFATMLIYLIFGAIGVPVFADGASGYGKIIGKTGGYLYSFPFAAAFISYAEYHKNNTPFHILCSLIVGTLLILIIGTIHLSSFLGIAMAFENGFKPFIPGGMIKICVAFIIILVSFSVRKLNLNEK